MKEPRRYFGVNMPEELLKKLKLMSVEERKSMTDIINTSVDRYLKKDKK